MNRPKDDASAEPVQSEVETPTTRGVPARIDAGGEGPAEKPDPGKKKVTRRRLPADEAQSLILDAARGQLEQVGPAGLRLKDLAAELGISHQAILHHFGSKERVIAAVVEQAFDRINEDLLAGLADIDPAHMDPARLLDRAFDAMAEGGQARLLAWLILSGEELARHEDGDPPLYRLASQAHVMREQRGANVGEMDTRYVLLLGALVVLGDSVFGSQVRQGMGLDDDDRTQRGFRAWLARLMVEHLDHTR